MKHNASNPDYYFTMNERRNDDVLLRIGPGQDPTAFLAPESNPNDLLDAARREVCCEDEEAAQSKALMRRLVVAFFLIVGIGTIFFIVMPYYGMNLPPILPVLVFIAIALAALFTGPKPKPAPPKDDDGRPIGCCSGPRPLRSFRERR